MGGAGGGPGRVGLGGMGCGVGELPLSGPTGDRAGVRS